MAVEFRNIKTNGINVRAAVEGTGPLVLMVHGFPESWYSWRHQMKPIADAGYTAAAIDVRGYGGSDRPHPIEAYDMESITADVAGVIDALSPNGKCIIVGHDWGAPIVYHTTILYPEKVTAVAGLSVPWTGYPARPMIDVIEETFTKNGQFFYIQYFQEPGVAEAEFEGDLRGKLRRFYYMGSGDIFSGGHQFTQRKLGDDLLTGMPDPDPFPAWLSPADIDYYVSEFAGSGLRGGISRYRNTRRDHVFMKGKDHVIRQPAVFIAGARDGVIGGASKEALEASMKPHFDDLRGVHVIPNAGHWTQQEAPEETNKALLAWLKSLPR
jgi:pimeloyl-ACP methyl ester carboxylesterase